VCCHRTIPDGCARWIYAEIIAALPVASRSDWPGAKAAPAIRADVFQNAFGAGPAEGAFKRADHRVRGIGWKTCVAVLASGPQFEHIGFISGREVPGGE